MQDILNEGYRMGGKRGGILILTSLVFVPLKAFMGGGKQSNFAVAATNEWMNIPLRIAKYREGGPGEFRP